MDSLDKRADGSSEDPVARNLEQLRRLFPDVFSEGQLDVDSLREAIGDYVEDRSERYRFSWHGKSEAKRIAQTPSTGTLRPCREQSVDWDRTKNLFMEGDNLEVLKLLQKSFHKRVTLIYIDPPYNTGKDFIYPDNYRDTIDNYLRYTAQATEHRIVRHSANAETSGRYHTNWLNMMFPRLKLARNLLSDDGAMFISIDDAEVANLRKLADEVFGEENFVAHVVWEKKYTRANDAKWFSDNHDHILVFARDKDQCRINRLPRTQQQRAAYSNPDHHPKGAWKATPLHAKSGSNADEYVFSNGVIWKPPLGTYRRFNDAAMRRMDENGEIWFGTDGRLTPQRKSFLCDVKSGVTPVTLWRQGEVGHNHEANNELKGLGLGGIFNNPKPTRLVRRMCVLTDTADCDGIVLDFFAGSATTAQAVLAQNAEDGGSRRFILVQLPEPCDPDSVAGRAGFATLADFGRTRITRVIEKLRADEEHGSANADHALRDHDADVPRPDFGFPDLGFPELGFKAFKLDSSNLRSWDAGHDNLAASLSDAVENIKPDRLDEDLLFELLLKSGLDPAAPLEIRHIAGKQVYVVERGALIVCLGGGITLDVVEGIADAKDELRPAVMRVVFQDSGFPDDAVKANAVQILRQRGIEDIKSL